MVKNKVKVMKEFNGQLTEVKMINVNTRKETFRWKGRTYILDLTIPLYRKKNVICYAYCLNAGQLVSRADFKRFTVDGVSQEGGELQLLMQQQTIDESIADQILDKHIFRDLGGQVMRSGIFDAAIIGYIIMAVMGAFAGLFFGKFLL